MTRQYAPVSPPVALTIAGSDSGGGAGIQADLKTMEAHDAFGTSVVTATTAQNTTGVQDVHVLPTDHIEAQYRAVVDDFAVEAVKTGMLATAPVIETVADCLADFPGPVVVDPVMVAATGDRLLSEDAEAAYTDLIGQSALVTPNVDEAEILAGIEIDDAADAEAAARRLVGEGAAAALVKGGHLGGDEVVDTLVVGGDEPRTERFSHPRIDTDATHGSGCTLSSAIAARLAGGESLVEAVAGGVGFLERAVRYGIDVGSGAGSVHHMVDLRERADRVAVRGAVTSVIERLAAGPAGGCAAEGAVTVVGTSRYAERTAEVVDGQFDPDHREASPAADPDTAAEVAERLLAARESHPDLRFAADCRLADRADAALAALDGPVGEAATAGGQAPVAARREDRRGIVVFAPDADALTERLLAIGETVETGE